MMRRLLYNRYFSNQISNNQPIKKEPGNPGTINHQPRNNEPSTNRWALFSCYDKTRIEKLAQFLYEKQYNILATTSTWDYLHTKMIYQPGNPCKVMSVEQLTGYPDICDGRVKTLHPKIHGGILSLRNNHIEHEKYQIPYIDVVVCNLYPFLKEPTIENIDIGGVALIRAAAKNYEHVNVITSLQQYDDFMDEFATNTVKHRKEFAKDAFGLVAEYDGAIANWFSRNYNWGGKQNSKNSIQQNSNPKNSNPKTSKQKPELKPSLRKTSWRYYSTNTINRRYEQVFSLKYGMNPHQHYASVMSVGSNLKNGPYGVPFSGVPFSVLNGDLSYINVLDAMNAWHLVQELSTVFNNDVNNDVNNNINPNIVAASFKHTSPAGVAMASSSVEAYRKARDCDPLCSFGDFIAISHTVDEETAEYIKTEVSDGIIAPEYTPKALEILKEKKGGNYVILQNHANLSYYCKTEIRELYGFALIQQPNIMSFNREDFRTSVTHQQPTLQDIDNMMFANICLKYGQSNNVAIATQGQLIGMSAGQQSRIHSTRLACHKAKVWLHRQNPELRDFINYNVVDSVLKQRQTRTNIIIRVIEHFLGYPIQDKELHAVEESFKYPMDFVFDRILDYMEQHTQQYIKGNQHNLLGMASDAFFPFRDNIDCAAQLGVRAIAQPGGSNRDKEIIQACEEYDISLICHKKRMFMH